MCAIYRPAVQQLHTDTHLAAEPAGAFQHKIATGRPLITKITQTKKIKKKIKNMPSKSKELD